MEKKVKNKFIVQGLIFVISFGIAFFGASYFLSKNKDNPNTMLVQVSEEMNRSMPKMIDAETRLDSTSVTNETLNYHYTLVNILKDSSQVDFNAVKSEMMKKAQININTNETMKDYRENNVSLHYIFKDKNQNDVFDYTVKHTTKN